MRVNFFRAVFTKGRMSYIGMGDTEGEARLDAIREYKKRTGKKIEDGDDEKIKVAPHRGPASRSMRQKRGK